jgi:hypothetical protein
MKSANNRVQGTRHKVSGPLTRDVRIDDDDNPGVTLTGW